MGRGLSSVLRPWVVWLWRSILPTWLGILSVLSEALGASEQNLVSQGGFRHATVFGKEQGLPSEQINAISQTSDGYLWVATERGLARWDGNQIRVFDRHNHPAFEEDRCRALAVDGSGKLWIGTENGLIARVDRRFVRFTIKDGLPTDGATLLYVPQNGELWVGHGRSLTRRSRDQFVPFTSEQGLRGSWVTSISETPNGKVWLANGGYVHAYEVEQNRIVRHQTTELDPIMAINHDSAGVLWAVAKRKLYKLVSGDWQPMPTSAPLGYVPQAFLWADSQTNLWVPCDNFGLLKQQNDQWVRLAVVEGRSTGNATCMFEDREGTLWIGTDGQGLHRWEFRGVRLIPGAESAVTTTARTVCVAPDGHVWLGGDSGAVRIGGRENLRLGQPEGLISPDVRSIAVAPGGGVWLGTKAGLYSYDHNQLKEYRFPGAWFNTKIRSLLMTRESHSDDLWVGTVHGLHCLSLSKLRNLGWLGTNQFHLIDESCETRIAELAGLAKTEIGALFQDRLGTVWAGAKGRGLARIQPGRLGWVSGSKDEVSQMFYAIAEDAEGNVWAGGDLGLFVARGSDLLRVAVSNTSLSTPVYGLAEDRTGFFWIAGERSLVRVRTRELIKAAEGTAMVTGVQEIGARHGLASLQVSGQTSFPAIAKGGDGLMWIATLRGLAVADPAGIRMRWPELRPGVDEVKVENRLVLAEGLVDRDYDLSGIVGRKQLSGAQEASRGGETGLKVKTTGDQASRFVLTYGPGSLSTREGVQYRYRLSGLDKDWIDAGNRREAYYHQVQPGRYAFQVAARESNDPWTLAAEPLEILVVPMWYQRKLTWVTMALGVVSVVLLAIRRRFHNQLKFRTLEWQNQSLREREAIVRRLHDELGPEITAMGLAASIARASKATPEELGILMARLARSADAAKSVMGKLMTVASAPSQAPELQDLIAEIVEDVKSLAGQSTCTCRIQVPSHLPSIQVPTHVAENLPPTIKELVINSIKHSGGTEIRFSVSLSEHHLLLTIEDNGCGLNLDEEGTAGKGGRGIRHLHERCGLMGGRAELAGHPGSGAKWLLTIPLLPIAMDLHEA